MSEPPRDSQFDSDNSSPLLDLLNRAREGDDAARDRLFEKCRSYVGLVARAQVESWMKAKVDASDLVQQTLLEVHRGLDRFRGETETEWLAWLRMILKNNAADFVRRYRGTAKRQARREVPIRVADPDGSRDFLRDPSDPGESPSQIVLRHEREIEVADAVSQLPEDYQEVIMLRNLQRLPFDEVARRMGRSRPATQMLWMRAIRKLQETLQAQILMTQADADRPEDPSEPPDQVFGLLDKYLGSLHQRDDDSRTAMIGEHPDLAGMFGCLEALDQLAPTTAENDAGSTRPGEFESDTAVDLNETAFGKYRLIREIGRGGMGVVFLARQTDLDRTVALKMILSSHFATDDEINRFYAEARAAGRVRHSNVVGIHEVGEINGQHYFAMDYVEGRSLADMAAKSVLGPDDAARCLADVARAVQCLHEHNIVHRDLKPSNILLDENGKPFVTDFGLAKVFDSDSAQTRSGTIIGTPSYMSPEQAAGHSAGVTAATDIYSLGAILYELLTGRPPFRRETPHETLLEVLEGEATWPAQLNPQLAPELELICMRCLEKQPHARYASAAALADDLERYLRREPIEARPAGWIQRVRRWGRRQPALASHLGGLVAVATILQVMYHIIGADIHYHIRVMSILGAWASFSVLFQFLLQTGRFDYPVRFAWSAADVMFLTALLNLADGPIGPLLIGYPFLIAASGLFFRVRLVLFTTLVSLISYAGLLISRPSEAVPYQYPVLFSATLAVFGFVISHQVYRLRALSRYYEHRRLP